MRVLRTSQIRALQTLDLKVMSTQQIASMGTSQLNALSTAQISALSAEQKTAAMGASNGRVTPIVLDLNGDGVQTLSLSQNIAFDIMASGHKVKTGWVSTSDGLLAMDRNHDGLINDGSELFGSATRLADGGRAQDGYQALAQLDSNDDGMIDKSDAAFSALGVWVDANSDGITQSGEMHTMASLGIVSLSLKATEGDTLNEGNLLGLNATYQSSDGTIHAASDVWFAVAPADSLAHKVSAIMQAISAFDVSATAPSSNGSNGDLGRDAPMTCAVAGLVQAMQRFSALNSLDAPAATELRYSVAPGAQLAMLAEINSNNANLLGFLASPGPML